MAALAFASQEVRHTKYQKELDEAIVARLEGRLKIMNRVAIASGVAGVGSVFWRWKNSHRV